MRFLSIVTLAVVVTASLAAVACGELVYLDRRNNPPANDGVLELRGSDGSVTTTYTSAFAGYPEGVGLSPNGSLLYMADQGGDLSIYNTVSGVLTDTWAIGTGAVGVAVDDNGNIYCSGFNGYIIKFEPDGTRHDTWGTRVASYNDRIADLEIYDGKLYGAGQLSSAKGVYYWDLSSGGAATLLGGTGGSNYEGLAFAPDGTLYTSKASEFNVKVWNSDYSSYTELVSFIEGSYTRRPNELDYFNGSLYVTLRPPDGQSTVLGEIRKISDLTTTPTMVTYATATAPAEQPRYLAITEIPEPSTLALLATGLIGLLAYAWRKRK